MSATSRLFVALLPPQAVQDHLATAITGLHLDAVPRRPEAPWHITTAFIGEVDDAAIPLATAAVAAACATTTAFRLSLAGAGRFGRGRYSVVWAGVDGDVAALVGHVAELRAQLGARGLPYDQRQYRPHVTLARTGDRLSPGQSAADLMSLRAYSGPSWMVSGCVLYAVDPGPTYRAVSHHALTAEVRGPDTATR
ncbi:RNA 2',3'-cyclic phosphodiesterase [Stackebrandtia soli]|uniref:RNA 2',3'-cyclic phosphodiesterase n=1 Tax=Stackebrandtia soli TaxID=1892856 RepID=UPI0039EA55A8